MRKKVISISGGQTSAYIAANYESDALVFALVRTSDQNCLFKDRGLAKKVEDRIGADFIGTLEDDIIINTIFDLEQYLGKKIDIVSGPTFDEVIEKKGKYLPNRVTRFCTTLMKIDPIFYWCRKKFNGESVDMALGFRANEQNRAAKLLKKCNKSGLDSYRAAVGPVYQNGVHKGKNRVIDVFWRRPYFPLIDDNIFKDEIEQFWQGKKVRFANYNNCVGCFWRSAAFLNQLSKEHPLKFEWFISQEDKSRGYWKSNVKYKDIKNANFTGNLFSKNGCTSGYCGI